jgi:hypothetical protein
VVWSNENQISGDTIYLYTANKKPERLYVFENALAVSRVDSTQFFNQLKGNSINALFNNGDIYSMRAKGSAENVYYNQDDQKRFISVSKSTSDVLHTLFKDNKPDRVSFINSFDGTMYPMRQVNHEEIRVRNFRWLDKLRPKSRYDVLAN